MTCDHKWAKWAKPQERTMTDFDPQTGLYKHSTFWLQWHECEKCGQSEVRYVELPKEAA